jgi:hypothetical protein
MDGKLRANQFTKHTITTFFRRLDVGRMVTLRIIFRGGIQHIHRTKLDAKAATLAPALINLNGADRWFKITE